MVAPCSGTRSHLITPHSPAAPSPTKVAQGGGPQTSVSQGNLPSTEFYSWGEGPCLLTASPPCGVVACSPGRRESALTRLRWETSFAHPSSDWRPRTGICDATDCIHLGPCPFTFPEGPLLRKRAGPQRPFYVPIWGFLLPPAHFLRARKPEGAAGGYPWLFGYSGSSGAATFFKRRRKLPTRHFSIFRKAPSNPPEELRGRPPASPRPDVSWPPH